MAGICCGNILPNAFAKAFEVLSVKVLKDADRGVTAQELQDGGGSVSDAFLQGRLIPVPPPSMNALE